MKHLLATLALISLSAFGIEQPNVLFIISDDLTATALSCYGNKVCQTPNIDRLANEGILFTNAHCQSPLCNSSRTSLMTGLRPSTSGIYGLAPWFRQVEALNDRVTLPQHLKQHGYHTYTTGKIYHGGYPPRDQRKAEYDHWGPGAGVGVRPDQKLVTTPFGNHPLVDWGTFPHHDEDKGDWKVADWAIGTLNEKPKEPFFLSVGFFLPHVPCYATQKWFDIYPLETLQLPPMQPDDREDTPLFSWFLHWRLPEPRLAWLQEVGEWEGLVRAYLATISFVDSQVGRVLDALEENGFQNNTIIVLWSDHGWHLGEKAITGKNTLWDRSTRVPLIFAGPGVAKSSRCSKPAELLDLYPTLSDLAGLPQPSGLEGHSLLPQLKDADSPRKWPAITTHNHDNHGIRSEHWRYIRYADGSEELYDMRKDPNEWDNLAGDPQFASIKKEHAAFLPERSLKPVKGSASRILLYEEGVPVWEGQRIHPGDLIPGK